MHDPALELISVWNLWNVRIAVDAIGDHHICVDLLQGNHAAILGRGGGNVTVPPPGGGLAETLAVEVLLNSLEEFLDLLSSLLGSSTLGFSLSVSTIGLDALSLFNVSVSVLSHALLKVLDLSIEHESSVGTLVSLVTGFMSGLSSLPAGNLALHLSGVGLEAFRSDVSARARSSAHSGRGSNSNSLISLSDDGTNALVSLFLASSKLGNGHVLVLLVGVLSFVGDLLLKFFGLLSGLKESASSLSSFLDGRVVISSSSADFIDGLLRNGVDHQNWDSHNEHEDAYRREDKGVEDSAASLFGCLDLVSEGSSNEEVESNDVEDHLGTPDQVLESAIQTVEIKE